MTSKKKEEAEVRYFLCFNIQRNFCSVTQEVFKPQITYIYREQNSVCRHPNYWPSTPSPPKARWTVNTLAGLWEGGWGVNIWLASNVNLFQKNSPELILSIKGGALCRSMSLNFNVPNINVLHINGSLLQPWVVEVQSTLALPKALQINGSIHQRKITWKVVFTLSSIILH